MNIKKWIGDWSFKKPIYIDCYTSKPHVYEYAPIESANNFLPDWWKAIPKDFSNGEIDIATMRRCAGFINLYGKGLMVPMWSDVRIQLWENGAYRFNYADEDSTMTQHPAPQSGTLLEDSNTTHIKLISPWAFECAENIDWHWAQPVWNHSAAKDFCVLSGVLNFKYTKDTHINILFKRQDIIINMVHGMPLVHVVPLSDRPVKIRTHLISAEEFSRKKQKHQQIAFAGTHYKQKKILWEQS